MAENESKKPTGAYVVKDIVTNAERNITVFTINGNLTEFTQWEQGYSLTNPNMKAGDAVQFFSGAGDGSIMTAKEEGGVVLVEVPNVMLKHASNITARFVGGGDYTSFAVIGRKKPKDYVFIDNEYKEKEPTSGGGGNSTYNVEYIVGDVVNANSFKDTNYIKKVSMPNVTTIEENSFNTWTGLTDVDFPNVTGENVGADGIGERAFYCCDALTTVNFPNAKVIRAEAFSGCDALTTVNFPKVEEIYSNAFGDCSSLATPIFPKLKQIDGFDSCDSLITITALNFPIANYIREECFVNCYNLTTVDLPLVEKISHKAFASCHNLTVVNMPSLEFINYQSFYDCPTLTILDLQRIKYIGEEAFSGCTSLMALLIRSSEVCSLDLTAFVNTKIISADLAPTGEGFIYVPKALLESYIANFVTQIIMIAQALGTPMDEATATYLATAIFRPLEDYTVDGTVTGELDESKI